VLDLKTIREDPDTFRRGLARRAPEFGGDLDRVLELDGRRRELTATVDELRAEQNRGSKAVGRAAGSEREALIASVRKASDRLSDLEPQLTEVEAELGRLLDRLPNVPHESVPEGETDEDNELLDEVGDRPAFGFEPRDHVDLGEALGVIDLERAARVSGSRFAYLLGGAVMLQFALVRYCLDRLAPKGFIPAIPPVMVREEALYGTGFFPSDEASIYATRDDDLYLVGTSEVPLAGLHGDEILDPGTLPRRYVGYSTCFRREAGAHGKDTRGVFRVHQFDKVEMFSFTEPERSWEEHEFLRSCEEELIQGLEIPYRVMNVCTGELGASAAKKYDIEAWLPGQERYRELTSCSNTTDYQARRLGIRVRYPDGNRAAHTLNGTACAVGRTLIALLENRQQEDGSVPLPEVLHPYLPEEHRVLRPF
jgi:seryl-tRNA synthetase